MDSLTIALYRPPSLKGHIIISPAGKIPASEVPPPNRQPWLSWEQATHELAVAGYAHGPSPEPQLPPGPRLDIIQLMEEASKVLDTPEDRDNQVEEMDNISVISLDSVPGLTNASTLSPQDPLSFLGASQFSILLSGDENIRRLIQTILRRDKVGPEKLQRNFLRLLRQFGIDLRGEATNDLEIVAARVAMRQRRTICNLTLQYMRDAESSLDEFLSKVELPENGASQIEHYLENLRSQLPLRGRRIKIQTNTTQRDESDVTGHAEDDHFEGVDAIGEQNIQGVFMKNLRSQPPLRGRGIKSQVHTTQPNESDDDDDVEDDDFEGVEAIGEQNIQRILNFVSSSTALSTFKRSLESFVAGNGSKMIPLSTQPDADDYETPGSEIDMAKFESEGEGESQDLPAVPIRQRFWHGLKSVIDPAPKGTQRITYICVSYVSSL